MGIKVNEIKSLTGDDINNMTKDDLINFSKSSVRFSKQRLATIGNKYTPAKSKLKQNQGDALPKESKIESMTHNELKKLVADTRNFLKSQTSTLSGERERIRNFVELSIDKKGKSTKQVENLITRQINKMGGYWKLGEVFDLIDQIEELEPSLVYELGSGTEDEKGFIGTILESYTQEDFKGLRDDPVQFAQKLRSRLDESIRTRNEFEF